MKSAIQHFPPAYFALVMSTGIISLAAHQLHLDGLAEGLFYLNVVAFPLLLALLLARLLLFFPDFRRELTDHATGANFLTVVAAAALLGNQFLLLRHNQTLAAALWLLAVVAWLGLLYGFVLGVSLSPVKPPLAQGLNGSWLLLAVSTEALAVLGAGLAEHLSGPAEVALFGALSLHLLGSAFYLVLITLLVYRLTFQKLEGEDVGAAYWISVGASAITVLAGATLAEKLAPALPQLVPFVKAYAVLFWALSTWWLPLVAGLRLWNHLRTKPAFAFSPAYWSMVFPLGMYTAATGRLAEALPLPALQAVPRYFFWLAAAAWLLTAVATLWHLATVARAPQPASVGHH
ncbi:tellurite resistance/C4-dicarboxylate transporter family protein [Hymenobacter sp. 15J16-1T3B]|uniref:tellurite resistance/C4-dicarboxylate transporter family protein n=1 Tax=Hymenobacter sp. 15J16-1T3B TaxID=2886941 RepID=UPI001D0F9026|nr:tellurite resistance/C4-dicarboxylate transporter family protein [Hymenobacter sp. 15J16-1T3B]MCC3160114.1 tellurite resistance/C4-dicarboxylate transporter family protein [Hymenobacter sp. 15J16-1T3B]